MCRKVICTSVALMSLLSATGATTPSYVRYRMFELALSADVVAAGTISSVGRKTFELSVEEVIVGDWEAPGATLPRCPGNSRPCE